MFTGIVSGIVLLLPPPAQFGSETAGHDIRLGVALASEPDALEGQHSSCQDLWFLALTYAYNLSPAAVLEGEIGFVRSSAACFDAGGYLNGKEVVSVSIGARMRPFEFKTAQLAQLRNALWLGLTVRSLWQATKKKRWECPTSQEFGCAVPLEERGSEPPGYEAVFIEGSVGYEYRVRFFHLLLGLTLATDLDRGRDLYAGVRIGAGVSF